MTASALAQSATLRAERPDRVEGEAQGKRAFGRDALPARLEADDTAQRRRYPHRAAGIAADGDLAEAVGGGDRGARRRAARHARAIARIARRAEMRIGADGGIGEFGHVGLGDDHRAGGAQPAHHDGVDLGRRRLLGEDFRAGAGRLAGDIEQILDADDGAVERPLRYAVSGAGVDGIGRGARGVGIDRKAGPRPLPVRVGDAGQRLFEPIAAGERLHAELSHTSPGDSEGSNGEFDLKRQMFQTVVQKTCYHRQYDCTPNASVT